MDNARSAATAPLRTPEQMEWIRDRFKPDGLRRLALANRDYADDHGVYLPDVAALAYAEWERAEAAERALAEYEASVMGVLARLPNHWQTYRDPLELGVGIRKARLLGREALDRVLADV